MGHGSCRFFFPSSVSPRAATNSQRPIITGKQSPHFPEPLPVSGRIMCLIPSFVCVCVLHNIIHKHIHLRRMTSVFMGKQQP